MNAPDPSLPAPPSDPSLPSPAHAAPNAPPRSRRSLKLSLTLTTAAGTSLVLAAMSFSLYFSVQSALLNEFDDALRQKAISLAGQTEQHDERMVFEGQPAQMPEFSRARDLEYFQILLANGHTLAQSVSLEKRDLQAFTPLPTTLPTANGAAAAPAPAAHLGELTLPSGHPGRLIQYSFMPRFERDEGTREEQDRIAAGDPMPTHSYVPGPVTLLLARPTTKLDSALFALRIRLIVLCSAAVMVSAALMTLLVRRGLRPVSKLAAQISSMGEADLNHRILLPDAPEELAPVVGRLNELLGRLESAFDRERAFTADAAHELRTPLAGIQTALEVAASQPRQPREYQAVISQCLKTTRRTSVMIDNLLMLARAESRQLPVNPEPVDLPTFLHEQWLNCADRAAARQLSPQFDLPDELIVQIDPIHLCLIIRNLFDNAVSYANTRGQIIVHCEIAMDDAVSPSSPGKNPLRPARLTLTVRNSGCTLSPADITHIFERFWRHDVSRNNAEGHHGLGLPLCRRVAEGLGGTLIAALQPNQQFEITLQLPLKVLQLESPQIQSTRAVSASQH